MLGTRDSRAFAGWVERERLPPLRQRYGLEAVPEGFRDGWVIRLIHEGDVPPA